VPGTGAGRSQSGPRALDGASREPARVARPPQVEVLVPRLREKLAEI
jgi:hypothetical protein